MKKIKVLLPLLWDNKLYACSDVLVLNDKDITELEMLQESGVVVFMDDEDFVDDISKIKKVEEKKLNGRRQHLINYQYKKSKK